MPRQNPLKPIKILVIAGKAGRVTVRYPTEKPIVSPEFRGLIKIDAKKCIGCGACVNTCPPNALEMLESEDSKILKYYAGRCIFCWRCVEVCPVKAIEGTREFELATNDPVDLQAYVAHGRVRCTTCSKPAETRRLRSYILTKARIAEEYSDKCPECRRKKLIRAISLKRVGYVEE